MKPGVLRSVGVVLVVVGVLAGCGGGSSVLTLDRIGQRGRPEHDDGAAQQQLHPPGRHAELGGRVREALHQVRRGPPGLEDRPDDHPRRRRHREPGEAAREGARRARAGLRERRLLHPAAVHQPEGAAADRPVLHAGGEAGARAVRAGHHDRARREALRLVVADRPARPLPPHGPRAARRRGRGTS